MSPEPTGVHGLLKQRKLFTHTVSRRLPNDIIYYEPAVSRFGIRTACRLHSFFFLFSCPHLEKKRKISPLSYLHFFSNPVYLFHISKTHNSAEDIFLSQKKVIAEIIHGFCHDLRTVAIQYGYPQDIIGKLPDQRQIVL